MFSGSRAGTAIDPMAGSWLTYGLTQAETG
jgi:hypothetical protein